MTEPLLDIRDLSAGYGDFQALFSVSLTVAEAEVLALIGANGAGKSTLLKAVTGLVPSARGMVRFRGEAIGGEPAHRIAARGIALVPEGRRLFRSLTVEENLLIGGEHAPPGPWTLERIYALFPVLRGKRHMPGTALSGGQQQMVAIGRALLANPALILLDEVSLGLAPIIVNEIYAALPAIRGDGVGVVLVEQDVGRAMRASDRLVCLGEGRVTLAGPSAGLGREAVTAAYFGT